MQSSIPETSGQSILVVDDNREFAVLVTDVLRSAGYQAQYVVSGSEALERIWTCQVDLVLLDVVMPVMDGISVAMKIKEHFGASVFVPIIMISALQDERDKIAGLKFADDYLTKPFSFDELLARIRSMLRIQQLQKELRASQNRYQRLYDSIPEMCVSLTDNLEISDCNEVFCAAVAMRKEQIIGRRLASFFEETEALLLEQYLGTLEPRQINEKHIVLPMRFLSKDGELIQAGIKAFRMGEEDAGLAFVVAMNNLSRELKLEWEQKSARMHLYRAARLASIGTLASGVAHEINNPLAAILGFSDALLHRIDNNEPIDRQELDQYLRIIVSETLRCRDIVDNLSRFARESESQIQEVVLAECIDSALTLVKPRAVKKNIQIECVVGPEFVVRTDSQKISQVLFNVLSNALDFTQSGGAVRICIDEHSRQDDMVRLQIIDNGPGISESIQSRIFDPFFTTKEVGRGLGLGLAICHKIMEDCEGTIDVTSESGRGTTVTLELPKK